MGLIDNFLDALKLNDDFEEDEAFIDDDFDDEEEYESSKVKPRFFRRMEDEDELDGFDDEPEEPKPKKKTASKSSKPARETKETLRQSTSARKEKPAPRRQPKPAPKRRSSTAMEVSVIKPVSMEDGREICDTLLDECTVVLNLEGLDVDLAQRIIDFTCGACYSIGGSIQMISSYIFILTPSSVDITGDYQTLLDDAFDIPAMKQY
ncbi:MAG: cell division protein SepF [Lachnospiraceae bacterium]|nr:cell division protein SepF [Lachnospiraceae bacterium]